MTKLVWDQLGERFYETGVDRGVLYLADGRGVSWSGLTSVDEDFGGDGAEPRYLDGVKYSDNPLIGDYSATIGALTYPEEFLEYDGVASLGNGLYVGDQEQKPFGMSYRTLVGNDTENESHGYKIHILYNLMASADETGYETHSDSPSLTEFTWRISSIPEDAPGYRPTAHVILDSRYLGRNRLNGVEDILYGTETTEPRIPSLGDLIDLMRFWNPKTIIPQSITGLADLVAATSATGDITESYVSGVFLPLSSNRLVETATPGLYQLP